jgi:hypothetical protein
VQQALADPETRKLLIRAGQKSEIENWGKVNRATGAGHQ